MNIVYFSHSYRKEDADVVKYFGRLLRSEGLVEHLKAAGKWGLDLATKIGTTVAVEAIKKSLGL
jgi:hypothetical protein